MAKSQPEKSDLERMEESLLNETDNLVQRVAAGEISTKELFELLSRLVDKKEANLKALKSMSLSIRIRGSLVNRMADLVDWCETQPEFEATDKVTVSDVHRTALAIGIRELEKRKKKDE